MDWKELCWHELTFKISCRGIHSGKYYMENWDRNIRLKGLIKHECLSLFAHLLKIACHFKKTRCVFVKCISLNTQNSCECKRFTLFVRFHWFNCTSCSNQAETLVWEHPHTLMMLRTHHLAGGWLMTCSWNNSSFSADLTTIGNWEKEMVWRHILLIDVNEQHECMVDMVRHCQQI